jgi:hypothetical protein
MTERDVSMPLRSCELRFIVQHPGGLTSTLRVSSPSIIPRQGERVSLGEIEGWEGSRPLTTGVVKAVTHRLTGTASEFGQVTTVHIEED